MAFDLLLRGGLVVDGTGSPARRADVAVRDGRIGAVGMLDAAAAERTVDCTGKVVTPGFVDVHSHRDVCDPAAQDEVQTFVGLRQGVTTEVTGNCGFSPFPTRQGGEADTRRHLAALGRACAAPAATMAAFRARMAATPPPVNLAPLVGHGTLRGAALGFAARAADPAGLRRMLRLLYASLDEGAFGLSTGLVYPPGVFADAAEVGALVAAVAARGRVYATHVRDEGDRVVQAVDEALAVARHTGVRLQISHHKVAGRANHGRSAETLRRVEETRRHHDVALDSYPYAAASTTLRALLPPWVHQDGVDGLLSLLEDGEARRRLRTEVGAGTGDWQDLAALTGWEGVVLASLPGAEDLEGRSIAALAEEQGAHPVDTVSDLLLEAGGAGLMILHMMDPAEVRTIGEQSFSLVGSDGIAMPGKQHPRVAGTFARRLRDAVGRDRDGLAAVVHRMTALPAARFNLPGDRGHVRPGAVADLVVFDPERVADRATYEAPWEPPAGIEWVMLCGEVVVDAGVPTGTRAGAVLEPA